MSTGLPLFDAPYARNSETSRAAAKAIVPHMARLRKLVYDWLKEHGPATDQEMQDGTGLTCNCQTPRRLELVHLGLVSDTGETRKNRSGRAATVWRAAQ